MVILEWLVISVAHHSHHRLHEGLSCTQVPILEARHQVDVEVSFLVKHVHDLVPCTRHSVNIDAAEGLENLIGTLLVSVHRANGPHIIVTV